MKPTIDQIAKRFGATPEKVRAQFLANAQSLEALRDKAKRTGQTVRGYTASELDNMARRAYQQSKG